MVFMMQKDTMDTKIHSKRDKLITIVGPTAVGKTDLTLRLAEHLHSEVISGDAYQIYKKLNIGTAKPSVEELARVKHHLIDILESEDSYSVALFKSQCESLIAKLNALDKIPILSGGTGLYVQALLEGYQLSTVQVDTALRSKLDAIYNEKGTEGLLACAKVLAEPLGVNIPFTDKHRLYRTIELLQAGDIEPLQSQNKLGLVYEGPVIGLQRDREELYKRINLRVDMMVERGLFKEVTQLIQAGVSPDCQAFKGIGYKEVVSYLRGDNSKDRAIELIKQNTRHFAKRQITWYKRMPYIQWITIDSQTTDEDIYKKALAMITNLSQ